MCLTGHFLELNPVVREGWRLHFHCLWCHLLPLPSLRSLPSCVQYFALGKDALSRGVGESTTLANIIMNESVMLANIRDYPRAILLSNQGGACTHANVSLFCTLPPSVMANSDCHTKLASLFLFIATPFGFDSTSSVL